MRPGDDHPRADFLCIEIDEVGNLDVRLVAAGDEFLQGQAAELLRILRGADDRDISQKSDPATSMILQFTARQRAD
jgi:hypothetical protein